MQDSRRAPACSVRTMAVVLVEIQEWLPQEEQRFLDQWFKVQGRRDPRGAEGCSNIFEYLVKAMFAVARTRTKPKCYGSMFAASKRSVQGMRLDDRRNACPANRKGLDPLRYEVQVVASHRFAPSGSSNIIREAMLLLRPCLDEVTPMWSSREQSVQFSQGAEVFASATFRDTRDGA